MVELRGRRGHAIAMVVARVPAASRRRVWRRREDTLERQTSARVRGEAAEADVVEQDVLGVDERVRIRRGVRGGQVAGSHRRHTSDGSIEPLPELEHLPFGWNGRRTSLQAFTSPGPLVISNTARFSPNGHRTPIRTPSPSTVAIVWARYSGQEPSIRSATHRHPSTARPAPAPMRGLSAGIGSRHSPQRPGDRRREPGHAARPTCSRLSRCGTLQLHRAA